MIDIGTVRGAEVIENKDADEKSLMLQVEFTNADDLQSVELVSRAGEDVYPQPDTRVIVVDLAPAFRVAIAEDDGIEPTVSAGEKRLYSYDTTPAELAYMYLRDDSVLELNGQQDFAVRYNELKTAFDQLKSDFDNFVTVIYNLHNHPTAPVGPVSVPSVTGTSSTADMSNSKVDEVLIRGLGE